MTETKTPRGETLLQSAPNDGGADQGTAPVQSVELAVKLDFERFEYETRVKHTHAAMQKRGIDLLIVTDPSNMCWLSGYDGWSFYTHQCLLVPAGDTPLWFGREMDANGARLTSYLPDDRLIGYDDRYVQSPSRHPMDYLAQIITDRGWGNRRIGVEMDNYYYSAKCHSALLAHLPGAELMDATALVNWLRAVKSPRELGYMRKAARIVEAMHARAFEVIEPGISKKDLAAELSYQGITGVDDEGGDYPAIVPIIATGREGCAPHLTWDDTPIREGDVTFFEIAGCFKRYHCPLARSVFLGQPPPPILSAERALLEASASALDAARPGKSCNDIAQAFFNVLHDHGFEKSSRCGYSIGLSYPPDWGERTMSLRLGDMTELQPNMTFHFMPGLWLEDWGMEITESILITDTEAECLANVERKLFIK